jgi:hypothetical protein
VNPIDLITSIHSAWSRLSAEEQHQILDTVHGLHRDSELGRANSYEDSWFRFFAQQLLPACRAVAAGEGGPAPKGRRIGSPGQLPG